MNTKFKVLTIICCVVLLAGLTVGIVYAVSDRNTADNDTVDPSEVDKFTVDEEYAEILEEIKSETDALVSSDDAASLDEIQKVVNHSRDYSITEDSLAGRELFEGHLFADWRTNGYDESTLMALYVKEAIGLQYRRYLCEQYASEENADDEAVKSWLAHKVYEVSRVIEDVRDDIDANQPDYTGVGGEPLKTSE